MTKEDILAKTPHVDHINRIKTKMFAESRVLVAMEEYAKEQIKQDRERIKYRITTDENKWWIESLIDDVEIELT